MKDPGGALKRWRGVSGSEGDMPPRIVVCNRRGSGSVEPRVGDENEKNEVRLEFDIEGIIECVCSKKISKTR